MERLELVNYNLNVETETAFDPCRLYRGRFLINPAARSALMKEATRKRYKTESLYRGKFILVSYNQKRDSYWYSFNNDAMGMCLVQQVEAEFGMAKQAVVRHQKKLKKNHGR